MSFSFLPWPLYVLMTVGSGITVLIYSRQWAKENPLSLILGVVLISVGGILTGIHKLGDKMGFLGQQYLDVLVIVVGSCIFLGMIFVFWGVYNKVKHDPEKRKLVLIQIVILVVTLLFMASLALYAILGN